MAVLDVPSTGRALVDGQIVVGVPVRSRNVSANSPGGGISRCSWIAMRPRSRTGNSNAWRWSAGPGRRIAENLKYVYR